MSVVALFVGLILRRRFRVDVLDREVLVNLDVGQAERLTRGLDWQSWSWCLRKGGMMSWGLFSGLLVVTFRRA